MHGRSESRLGHGLAARSSRGGGPRVGRCGGTLVGGLAARFSVRAPPSHDGCAGQEKRRRDSLRRSGGGGVAGSGRRDGVPVEGVSG
jgi:hypothetical protein